MKVNQTLIELILKFQAICTNEKMDFLDCDFVKIEQWNSLLKTSVSAKILTAGSCYIIVTRDILQASLRG